MMRKWIVALAMVMSCAPALAGGDAAAGKEKSTVCAACHGADGVSPVPNFPKLAGQHPDYIVRALKDYKSGDRKNPIMAGQVTNLSEQDMEDLAAYFSSQKGLYTKH
ncbi:cytochrome c [Nitrogeniibacter mangrovi]|uniref:Cytochrome c n=1 Tax=Nitrogeniibacter mangrovi TaxID=2016596 RepID=A0A6C1B553_9RHOO|nr:cytochrome c [Nitrogeniibacter mangrovi]QID18139.1 cytochrome c [Nitrogeniibacter mangrovi]